MNSRVSRVHCTTTVFNSNDRRRTSRLKKNTYGSYVRQGCCNLTVSVFPVSDAWTFVRLMHWKYCFNQQRRKRQHNSWKQQLYHSGLVASVSMMVPGGGLLNWLRSDKKKRELIRFLTTITANFGLQDTTRSTCLFLCTQKHINIPACKTDSIEVTLRSTQNIMLVGMPIL